VIILSNMNFQNVLEIVKNSLEQDQARFVFENGSVSLEFKGQFPNNNLNINQTEVNLIMNDIVNITLMLLNNSHLSNFEPQGDADYLDKVAAVKNGLINDKLIRKYRFFNSPVINPLKSITAYPIIKPGITSELNMITVNMIIQYSDGSGADKKVNVEVNPDYIDKFIRSLEQIRDAIEIMDKQLQQISFMEEDG